MEWTRSTPEPGPARRRACHACTRPIESGAASARLVSDGGALRAVELCAACAGAPSAEGESPRSRAAVACSECGRPAPATGAIVASGGQLSILCGRCSGREPEPRPAPEPRPRRRNKLRAGAASVAAVALAAAGLSFTYAEPGGDAAPALAASIGTDRPDAPERDETEIRVPPRERPQVHDLSFATAEGQDDPLVWYHPIAEKRILPKATSRIFGAHRPGDRPSECGQGHCGVDLGYEAGPVVHAARPGLIDRIVKAPDRLSGKYVRIFHPEGFFTYYMHLDVIRPTLVPGVEVAAGDPIGTLGSTGISHSAPHLHFAVSEILDTGGQHYLDPEPMLKQAVVLDQPAHFPESWRRVKKSAPARRVASHAKAEEPAEVSGDTGGGDSHAEDGEPAAALAEPEAGGTSRDAAEAPDPEAGGARRDAAEAPDPSRGLDMGEAIGAEPEPDLELGSEPAG